MKIYPPSVKSIIRTNELICLDEGHLFNVINEERVESAKHAAFYPGDAPFVYGGVPELAGALCFFLTKAHAFQDGNKRTAAIVSLNFLNAHNKDLKYNIATSMDENSFAKLIEDVASNSQTKEQCIDWFKAHTVDL